MVYILDHTSIILIFGGSGWGKINKLLKLIKQPDTNKIYLYAKIPFESKYQLGINGREKVNVKKLKNPKAFIDYLQTIDNV